MDAYKIYTAALFACAFSALAIMIWTLRMNSGRLARFESLPRNKYLGTVLAFFCLLWCIPQAAPIVWEWLLPWLYPLAIVLTILGYFYLDYLFSRALGGLLILLTYYFVHEAFTFHSPALVLFAPLCWVLGIAGLFFSGKPHLLRDLIRKLSRSGRSRRLTAAYLALLTVFCLTLGIIHVLRLS
ncbi:MAG: hypothetical protein PHV59_01930 [Victivallales bacterium]|nr:hypothetical protein [Victivallales bacterium]